MATFIRAGIPILDGIEGVREQAVSPLFRRTDDLSAELRNGEPLSTSLARHPRVFSRLYVDMIVAAEATGELDGILDQLARYLERAEATSRRLRQAMLYPGVVLALAAVVIAILTTVVLPSFVTLFADFGGRAAADDPIMLAIGASGAERHRDRRGRARRPCWSCRSSSNARRVPSDPSAVILHIPVVGGLVNSERKPGSPARSGSCCAPACPSPAPSTSRDRYRATRPTSVAWPQCGRA